MKTIKNWFIGDYLAKTNDVFERSKIELLYNYSVAFFILGTLFYISLFFQGLWYHIYLITISVITLPTIPFILKYKQNVKLASIVFMTQQIIVDTGSMFLQEGKQDMSGGFWSALFILFAFFLFGNRNGILLVILSGVLATIALSFLSFVDIPDDQQFHDSANVILLPASLILIVVWMFIKTRSDAEKEIEIQKSLIEDKNKEVTDSINYAQRIQKAILPSHRLVDSYLPKSFIVYLPKDIVSGDFYWVEKKGDTVFFAVADCTGHGVPGAMISVIAQNALNRVLNEFNITKPAAMLDKLSVLVEEAFSKSGSDVRDGLDIALCALQSDKMKLEYAGANNPVYICSGNELIETKATKQPIGRFESRIPFVNHEIKLNTNDTIYLFSDGIADQFGGPDGKKFKYKRVKELLINNNNKSSSDQKNAIITEFVNWKGKNEQIDDVCIMGVKI